MTGPGSPESCSFTGQVASARFTGRGLFVLTEEAPFERGNAERVRLDGAVLRMDDRPVGPPDERNLVFERPEKLVPVKMNRADEPYDVTYQAGTPLIIKVEQGGGDGSFKGRAKSAPECANEFCEIVWLGDVKTVTLERASPKPMPLARFITADPGASPRPGLSSAELLSVKGSFSCKSGALSGPVDDIKHVWKAGEHNNLTLKRIETTEAGDGILIEIENESPPERSPHIAPPSAAANGPPEHGVVGGSEPLRDKLSSAGILVAAVIALGFVLFVIYRRRRRPEESIPSSPPTAPDKKPIALALVDSRSGPAHVLLVHANEPEDKRLALALEGHLRPLVKSGVLETKLLRQIRPGADIREEMALSLDWADMILLLTSARFHADEGFCGAAMARALERHAEGKAVVIPILLSSHLSDSTELSHLAPLPETGEPIASFGREHEDSILTSVAERLRDIAKHERSAKAPARIARTQDT